MVLAGTGDPNDALDSYYGSGVLRSADGAVVQSAQSNFAGYNGNAATAVVWNAARQRFYAAVRFHGYYQSADGVNWTRLANQPGTNLTAVNCPVRPNAVGSATCPIFRGALAVNAVTGDTFALTVDATNLDQGLWQDVCALSGGSCASGTVTFAAKLNSTPLETSTTNKAIAQGDYNLTLAAVPAAGDTLLFAGTADIYRCALAAGCALRNTTNANNGCATPAMVAGAQHAVAAIVPTGATMPLLYFGNDGGLWRSTDGVSETGSVCAAGDAAHFQNLNGGLGSLAEVVRFSQSPTDANTFIAGVGAMGTAATTAAATVVAWPQLSGGEGGFNAIDQTNPLNWYISTGAGVSVNLCAAGGACTAANFATQAAIGAAQTAADAAAIDAPFLLDPGLQSNLILATCRVWRGPAGGGSLWSGSNLISAILDGVAQPECTGSNGVVRSLAAGVTVAGGGSAQHVGSETIYAGMAGALDGGGIKGGHLFGTTAGNTAGSTTAWTDLWLSPVTNDPANNLSAGDAQFNPGLFDISSVTVDAHDATGATVYATVMGFSGNGVSEPHVYRSTDGGAHWANISSNLPNAPANSLVVDPGSANTVYVALDTGVYSTTAVATCATATVNCWSVFGAGLPNASVTELSAASGAAAGGVVTGVLRAGTYGRGIWQIPLLTATAVQAPAPVMVVSPAALSFAPQQAQTASAAQSVGISNTGNAPLTISQIAMTGDFTETDNCTSAAVAAGAGCAVQVSFLPSATGARTGTMTIYANVSGGQGSVALSGTGLAPAAVTLNPAALTFVATLLGATSAAQNITVTNSGGVGTALTAPVVSGDFAVGNNTCGATLAASSACAIAVTFTPTAAGTRSGTFSITDSSGTQSAALSGTGQAAATDALSPAALSFSAQTVGTSSASQQVTLTNSGDAALTLISVAATGDFTAVNGCGASLGGHSSCSISVAYAPRSTGAATGLLTVTDALRSQTVSLAGTGLAPAGVSLTPGALSFSNVGVGRVSGRQTVTLTNNGGSPLMVGAAGISGDFALVSNSCPASLAANAACALVVDFAPTVAGTRAGTLTVSDSAANSPQTVPLSGLGVDFGFAVEGSASQTVSANGGTGGYAILLTPASGVSGTVTLACTGAPANAVCSLSPATADLSQGPTLIQVNVSSAVAHSRWQPIAAALLLLPLCLLSRRRVALLCCVLCVAAGGCGSGRLIPAGSSSGPAANPTPTGSYSLTVTAVDGVSLAQHSVGLTLLVQ